MNELFQTFNAAGIRYPLMDGQPIAPQDQADIEFLLELQRLGKLT